MHVKWVRLNFIIFSFSFIQNLSSSSFNYDVCGILIGVGCLLVWLTLLHYLAYDPDFNVSWTEYNREKPKSISGSPLICGEILTTPQPPYTQLASIELIENTVSVKNRRSNHWHRTTMVLWKKRQLNLYKQKKLNLWQGCIMLSGSWLKHCLNK